MVDTVEKVLCVCVWVAVPTLAQIYQNDVIGMTTARTTIRLLLYSSELLFFCRNYE